MGNIKCLLVVLSLLAFANANLNVSNTLGSNMVLQRAPLQAQLWGWTDVGSSVVVSFNNQNLNANVESDGTWSISLPATQAGGPYNIGITSSSGDKLALSNILFGDVYVCSGQSNMQFTVDSAFNGSYEVQRANNYPNIRVFSVGTSTISGEPLADLNDYQLGWSVASSSSVGGGNWTYMSAVCWFFGRDLYDQYQVPVGLISTNWGGTIIQAWSSPEVLTQCNVAPAPYNATAGPNQNSVLWNAMIVPFLRLSIRGALWYQGESNVGNAPLYACLEPAMIADWRAKFGSGFKFPFLFVQLAPWIDNTVSTSVLVADLRASQLEALNLPSVAYASAVDLGDPVSPFNPIHPRNKQEVGRRLLLAARNVAYGEQSIVWQGPTFLSASQASSGNTANIQVTWSTQGASGLQYVAAECPPEVVSATCANWEVLLSDGTWYPATNAVSSSSSNIVTVSINLSQSATVKGIRYAYAIWPLTTLFSAEGLPAVPFEYIFSS